jgi:hypothetical protein
LKGVRRRLIRLGKVCRLSIGEGMTQFPLPPIQACVRLCLYENGSVVLFSWWIFFVCITMICTYVLYTFPAHFCDRCCMSFWCVWFGSHFTGSTGHWYTERLAGQCTLLLFILWALDNWEISVFAACVSVYYFRFFSNYCGSCCGNVYTYV